MKFLGYNFFLTMGGEVGSLHGAGFQALDCSLKILVFCFW